MKVLIENFIEKIETGDAKKSLDALDLIIDALVNDNDLVVEIIDPKIITELHEKLIEHLEVPPRSMMLNRRFPNSTKRAIMFSKAMRNGIARVVEE